MGEEKLSDSESPALEQYTPPATPNLADWSSPNDPEDPHNWSFGKKTYHASITAAYAFTTYVHIPGHCAFLLIIRPFQLEPSCPRYTPQGRTKYPSGLEFQRPSHY